MRILLPTFVVICGLFSAVEPGFAQTWTQTSAPITNWQSVASSADGIKLVATAGGYFGLGVGPIYISTNSGVSWIQSSAPITNWLHVASSADGSKLVAVGNLIYYSTNSGDTWTQADAPFPDEDWNSVASSADGSVSAVGELGGTVPRPHGIYLSTDSGATWYPAVADGSAVAASADGKKLVALEYNAAAAFVALSTNAGSTWKSNNVTGSQSWWVAASSADGVKLAAAPGGVFIGSIGPIYTSTNSGATWTSNDVPELRWSSIASSADGSRLVAAAAGGGMYTSIDSGTTWVSNSMPATNWASVASSADGSRLVAVVDGGGIYTLQTIPSPQLNLTPAGSNLTASWVVPSTNFVLQHSFDLSNWADVTNTPVLNFTNLQDEVVLSPTNGSGFFRLKTP